MFQYCKLLGCLSCHIGEMFIKYFSLLSIVTTRRVRFSLTGIVVLSLWNFGFGVCKLPMTIAWYFEWFCFIPFASHDVTKIQTTKLSMLLLFYFHGVLGQLKTNFPTNFRFKRNLGFVREYAWISKLLRDVTFTWWVRELSCTLKKWRISGNFAILTVHVHVLEKVLLKCLWVPWGITSRFHTKTR